MTDYCLKNMSGKDFARFASKIRKPEEALSVVRSGDRIFIGTACATPTTLMKALENLESDLSDIQLIHFLITGSTIQREGIPETRFRHRSFFVGTDTRDALKNGSADYIPISISQVPQLIENGRIAFDVALIQVSMPDEYGFVSLGVSVDITKMAAQKAKHVIAEINPNMPRTLGDTFLPLDEIDTLVMVETPVIEYTHKPVDPVAECIARFVSRLIEDGSTLQIGLGRIPNELLKYLTNRKDIGSHSDVITDPIVDLIEKEVITGKRKTLHKGKVVASYCMGTRRLYDLIDRNPMFSFHPLEYICDPSVIAKNSKMVSVTQAFAVDLTGQICSDQFQGEFYSGVSTQPDFIRSVAQSPGGKPIVCLPSTTEDELTSRIRPQLLEGEGVTIPRSDIHYVITEYGMAYLFGKSIRERTIALIEIAHPQFRPWLLEEAKRLCYVRPNQTLKSLVAYPVEEERDVILKSGASVLVRPARARDVRGLQDIFYNMSKKDVYMRFFAYLKALSVDEAEHLCNVDYENEMAFVAAVGDPENEKIVGSSCYFLNPTTNLAEVAYMILPEWQGMGLGSLLQNRMTEYARARGIRGFTAEVHEGNDKMIKLAQSSPNASMKNIEGTLEVTMLF